MALQISEFSQSLASGSMEDTDQWIWVDNQYGAYSSSFKAELGQVKGYVLEGNTIPKGSLVGTTESQSLSNKTLEAPIFNSGVGCDITSAELNALHGAGVSASQFTALGLATIGGSGANDIPVTGMYASASHTHVVADLTDYVAFTAESFVNFLASGSVSADSVISAITGKLYDSTRFAALVAANWSGSAV